MTNLGCVHDKCCLLHVLTDSQEGEEADTTLQGWLAVNETEIRSLLITHHPRPTFPCNLIGSLYFFKILHLCQSVNP